MKIRNIIYISLLLTLILFNGCGNKSTDEKTMTGMQEIENHNYADAIISFDEAEQKKENPQLIARGRGIASIELTNYEDAITYFKEALSFSNERVDSLDYDINFYLADAYEKNGDYQKSIDTYSSILGLANKDVTAYYLRGRNYLLLDSYENAIADFNKALSLDEDNYDLRISVAGQLSDAGYETEGKKYLNTFLESNEKKLSDYDKGRIYFYLQDYENAKVFLEKAKDDENQSTILFLGKAYEKLGDYNYATSVYQNYLSKHQDAAIICNQLGLCKLLAQDYEGALTAFVTAGKIENNGIEQVLEFNQIVANEYIGDFKQASVLMTAYCKKYPDDNDAIRENIFLQTR